MSEIGSNLLFRIVLCVLVAIIVWTAPMAYQLYSGERPHWIFRDAIPVLVILAAWFLSGLPVAKR